ncbi:HEAT repeat domain-containing protein [Polyangium sp. 15x6]|uniref:TRM11 family SAM-dependent methyltransferase n=1 Tax=Polyangium sp. 15x6 TaxID=3042687 RepID=UPI00249C6E72|nr:HEAT repeat domain-containing protein [Polyangium sp. 15x6]MDI3282300.1 HEAT repeat domain-containing protein [Polyangium sp. 15x6]
MTARRAPDFRLEEAIRDPGFSPRRSDAAALVELVAEEGERTDDAERSLLRLGVEAARVAIERARTAEAKPRARLVAFVGKVAAEHAEPELSVFLIGALGDADPRTRRFAANALGKLRGPEVAAALAAALAAENDAPARRAMAAALGKTGGDEAARALRELDTGSDELLARATAKASLMAQRTAGREVPSTFEVHKPAPSPVPVALHCRAGLAPILRDEIDVRLAPRLAPDGREDRVLATLVGPPERLFDARTMLFFGFPLPPVPLDPAGDIAEALARSLTSPEALRLLEHFTTGPIRFRIAWAGGGKRRASTWRAAEAIAAANPKLVNDPTESTWEALVHELPDRHAIEVELCPRVEDPRFTYRERDVPAASHPTIAAALVRVAGVHADDVVWDPFVGSGTELCERVLAGPYARLLGTDMAPAALEAARQNLAAVGIEDAVLARGDALSFVPRGAPPTVVLTNPPMGRRVLRGIDLHEFFDRFLAHVAEVLEPGGRIAWISPLPAQSARAARELGLERAFVQRLDMGGFDAELQLLINRRRRNERDFGRGSGSSREPTCAPERRGRPRAPGRR